MASSAFSKAMDKQKGAQKLLQKAKDAENSSFEIPEIEDGKYIARIRAGVGVTPNKGVPYVEFKWTIVDDDKYTGKGYRQTYFLTGDDPEKVEKTFEFLGKSLKALAGVEDLDMDDFASMEEIVSEIDADRPHARIQVKNWESNGKRGMTTYFNERVEVVQDEPEYAEPSVDATDVIPTNNEIVEKGQTVLYNGNAYEVMSSSPRTKTCTLKDDEGNRETNVEWCELEVVSA